ncbi:MAG: hypothetical protein ABIT04_03465 [Novosphingobium sp.]
MTRGIFRDREHAEATHDGKRSFAVARRLYELNGFQPPFDDLPTRESYKPDRA